MRRSRDSQASREEIELRLRRRDEKKDEIIKAAFLTKDRDRFFAHDVFVLSGGKG